MISEDTWISCGPITFEFYLNDGSYTSLDPLIFEDERSKVPYEFKYLHTTNLDHIGTYEIVCIAYYANYKMTNAESLPFTVEIVQACPIVTSFTASAPLDQNYTITDSQLTYEVPAFTVDPPFCEVIYSFTVKD